MMQVKLDFDPVYHYFFLFPKSICLENVGMALVAIQGSDNKNIHDRQGWPQDNVM